MAKRPILLWVFLAFSLMSRNAHAGAIFIDEEQRYSLTWGFDAYYTFLSFSGSLIRPTVGVNILDAKEEDNVYLELLRNIYIPRTFNLEASVNPLPLLGTYIKDQHLAFYNRAEVIDGLNLIESVSAGFPEPGAVSLFLGNNVFIVNFETDETEGIGYGGLLFSYGRHHIVSNTLVNDDWLEVEAKLKGIFLSETHRVSFSFRVGGRLHDHPNIRNTVYVSLVRSHQDREYHGWSPLLNSEAEFRYDMDTDDFRPSRFIAVFGKKMPSPGGAVIFSLALGVLGVFQHGYTGRLANNTVESGWTFLIRPNVSF